MSKIPAIRNKTCRQPSIAVIQNSMMVAVMACLLLLSGCNRKPETAPESPHSVDPGKQQNSSSDPADSVGQGANRPAVIPTKTSRVAKDDPAASGWKSEAVSATIDKQLKFLAKCLQSGNLQEAKKVATDAKTFHRLVADDLDVILSDPDLTVLRKPGSIANPSSEPQATNTNFETAIASYAANPDRRVDGHTKFKIFDIQLSESNHAIVSVYFQHFVAHQQADKTDQAALQVTATWKCNWTNVDSDKPQITSLQILAHEQVHSKSPMAFADCTEAVFAGKVFDQQFRMGVDSWLTQIPNRLGIDIGGWQGLAIGDVNGDQKDDVYVVAPGGLPNRLFIQQQDGSTKETSQQARVDWIESSHAALLVDLDNDGDQDLIVGVTTGLLIMSNDGTGKFTIRSQQVLPAALPYSISAADYDNDSDLDLYVCCYNRRKGINQHLLFARPVPYHDANNGGRNVLLRNEQTPTKGKWRFRYATGISKLDQNNRRFSYASAWEDFDDDGDLDLYVANDFGRNNLYRNDQGTFQDVAESARVVDIGPGMSTNWGDANNDGKIDLYVSNMFSSAGNRITNQSQFQADKEPATRSAFRRHARGNSLFLNQANGTFADVSMEAGVVLGRWAWGSKFVDLNNDGWDDLIVANGFITQQDTGDL